MAFFRICPDCGAHLDPGESCDCREIKAKELEQKADRERKYQKKVKMDKDGQYRLVV